MTFDELGIQTKPGKVRYSTICPKCNESRQKHKNVPCLTVNDESDNQWYHCNHCGWSGNLGSDEKYVRVIKESRMPKDIGQVATYSKEVRDYWEKRGIDFKIALGRKIFEFSMARKPVLGFPTYMSHTLVDVKYLDINWKKGQETPKWWNMKKEFGTRTLPWGIEQLNFPPEELKVVIWTEGHIDALTWEQCGYKNILSVPSGAPSPDAKNFEHEFDYLNDPFTKSVLADVQLHIIGTDNDIPGKKLRNHLALLLGKEKCKYINYPIGYKDINEVYKGVKIEDKEVLALGKGGVDECYLNLSSFPIAGVIRPMDVKEELDTYAREGFTPGLKCGTPEIDRLFTLKQKRLVVITGLPGAGKSTFIRWYITEVIRFNEPMNLKFGWFSPENRPVSREYAKMTEVVTGQYFREGWYNSMTKELRDRTLRYIGQHLFVISPDRRNFDTFNGKIKADKVNTLSALFEYLVYLKKTEDIFGYIIDAWNKIEHEQPKNLTETAYISSQLDNILDFNEFYDLNGIIIAHPTKIEKVGINYRMPCLYDIKGSSAWKEKSDIGIIAHRNMNKKRPKSEIPEDADDDDKYVVDSDAPTIIRTERVRFEEEGLCDRIKLRMDFKKGGRFFVYNDSDKKEIPPIDSKLNPAAKDDDDEPFQNGNGEQDKDLPF